jgi:uncharacterized repeat protein (TIGR01451 family)
MGWRQAWLGACLLLAGGAPARAAVITPEIVATFPTPGGSIKGLAWGDGSLWVADENKKIYRLSPTGTVEGSFSHTISDVSDLEWFEDSVWIHTGYNTYKLNSSGQIVETLNVAYWPGSGMAWAEGDLYLTDFNSAYVHKLTRAGSHVYSWSVGYSGGHPMAMTYDGSHLWILDSCEGTKQIRSWSLTGIQGDSIDLSLLGTCDPSIYTPKGLTWDGRYFWYAYGLNIYKLNTGGDDVPPTASVVSPSGGEYWLLSDAGSPPHTQVVTWTMSDNIRICRVRVSLWHSNDGGASYLESPAGGGLPATFGPGGSCTGQGERTTSLVYTVPTAPPSGTSGSLYKVQVEVTDHAGNTLVLDPQSGRNAVRSANPFYVVRSNPDSVRTLILSNTARMVSKMGISAQQASALSYKLQELAAHPKVQGFVVDLNGVTDLSHPTSGLYAAWDADRANPDKANRVLFGCHGPDLDPPAPLPSGCTAVKKGVHDRVRELIGVYTGVKYLILVGDDRIIPLARIQDRTVLLPEQSYPSAGPGQDLTPTGTTVGQALAANKYLSDDPLAVMDGVRPDELSGNLFLPDLSVGRLVETPEEMTTAIATFVSQDGVLDLSALDAASGHKVLVTGYDFLTDSAKKVRGRWKSALGVSTPDGSLAPVDGSLVGGSWSLPTVGERRTALRTHLGGNTGARYGVSSLSGHASHYEEGVPGTGPFDIQGLGARDIYGSDACGTPGLAPLSLAGGFVYAAGCHGGLPVSGSCASDADHSLDLPQTMLSRGVAAYVANTGYGWGLKYGVGYAERLMELLTEELSKGGTVVTGEAVRRAKLRYFLETPRYDPYDEKTLMQWTLFGLPMYAVRTGIAAGAGDAGPFAEGAPGERPAPERIGDVGVRREVAAPSALPPYLVQLNLHFDLTGAGVYTKWSAAGDALPAVPGCPVSDGCYYTLNGLVERSSGSGDLPVQPYLIFDSRLSGTSQHGVLWKGGTYDQETGWIPVLGELVSNGGDGSNHGSAPRVSILRPTAPRAVPGQDPDECRPSDLEMNSLVVGAGEAVKGQEAEPRYSIERRYRGIELEVYYYNDTLAPSSNCDRAGPALGTGPFGGAYHRASGTTVEWAVPATDPSGVWRVVVVANDNRTDAAGRGAWSPVELVEDGGTWRGSLSVAGAATITYVIQAVDKRGNLTWLDYVSSQLPASGVPLGVPQTVDVSVSGPAEADLSVTKTDGRTTAASGQPVAYTIVVSNAGPGFVTGATVTDTPPPALTGVSWTCVGSGGGTCTASGTGGISDTVNLPVAGKATYTLTGTISGSATGTLTNTASLTAPDGVTDLNPANNSAADTDTLQPGADLSVTKTDGQTTVVIGQLITYTIVVSNAGPNAANGATVTEELPAALTGVTWTCVGANGATCTASGSGSANDTVNLPVGGTVTYTVTGTVGDSATGSLRNTATVRAPVDVTDWDQTNNSAADTDTVLGAGLGFFTLAPCRVIDTRGSGAAIGGPVLQGQETRTFAVVGYCDIPSTARALSVNVTATQPTAQGDIWLYAAGEAGPTVSTLYYTAGQTRANNAIVSLNPSGELAAFVGQPAGTSVHLIIDVNGYFDEMSVP